MAVKTPDVIWKPQPGSQEAFLACPVYEVLYEGTRGPGKTDCLIMDFGQDVGRGWGSEWKGILFRQTYKQLGDVITKTKKWFPQIWPEAKFNSQMTTWHWPTGEEFLLRQASREDDYWNYHGHAYPWIGWEELTSWPNANLYLRLMSCSRSTVPGMPRKYRSTTNPYGPGHNWVKARFRLPQARGKVIKDSYRDDQIEPPRVAIHGYLEENQILLKADPDYIQRLVAAARNDAELRAWLKGDWDIVAGGMFDDVWDTRYHIVPAVPLHRIPRQWRLDRSFDWGSSKPFSVGWWAQSNGEPFVWEGKTYGRVRGDLYRIAEWYGWNGTPNEGCRMLAVEIAEGIRDLETDWGIRSRVRPGPADSSIFDIENGVSIANDMARKSVSWIPADKRAGSRKQGWELMRKMMKDGKPTSLGPREFPGIFAFDSCHHFLRTVPVLPRSDKDLDDVNTDAEDHAADDARYRIRRKVQSLTGGNF